MKAVTIYAKLRQEKRKLLNYFPLRLSQSPALRLIGCVLIASLPDENPLQFFLSTFCCKLHFFGPKLSWIVFIHNNDKGKN